MNSRFNAVVRRIPTTPVLIALCGLAALSLIFLYYKSPPRSRMSFGFEYREQFDVAGRMHGTQLILHDNTVYARNRYFHGMFVEGETFRPDGSRLVKREGLDGYVETLTIPAERPPHIR